MTEAHNKLIECERECEKLPQPPTARQALTRAMLLTPTKTAKPAGKTVKEARLCSTERGNALLEMIFALALFALIATGIAQTTLALFVAARAANTQLLARTANEALFAVINSRERARYDQPNDPPQPPFDVTPDPNNPERTAPTVINNQTTLRLNACPAACRVIYQITDPNNNVQYVTRAWTAPPPQGATPRLLVAYRIDDLYDPDGRWRGRSRRTAAVWDFPPNLNPGTTNGSVQLPPPRLYRSITITTPR